MLGQVESSSDPFGHQLRISFNPRAHVGREWGSIFGDPIIGTAILDRLLHHSTTINIRGESYRLKERRKAGLIPLPEHQQEPTALPASSRGKQSSL